MGTISVKEIGHDSRNRVLVGANVTEWRKVWRIEKGYASTRCLGDRKSTRLNSSHLGISYAVFCLKKKKMLRSIPMFCSLSITFVYTYLPLVTSDEDSGLAFFFNDTATTEIYTLSLHDALPISHQHRVRLIRLGDNPVPRPR